MPALSITCRSAVLRRAISASEKRGYSAAWMAVSSGSRASGIGMVFAKWMGQRKCSATRETIEAALCLRGVVQPQMERAMTSNKQVRGTLSAVAAVGAALSLGGCDWVQSLWKSEPPAQAQKAPEAKIDIASAKPVELPKPV